MTSIAANPKSRRQATDLASEPRPAEGSCTSLRIRAVRLLTSTLGLGLLGSLLMFVALPPCDLWPLGWIAPVP